VPASPPLAPPRDDRVQKRAHPGNIGRIIHVDRALHRTNQAVEGFPAVLEK